MKNWLSRRLPRRDGRGSTRTSRWPGYYYRGDYMKLDDQNWHCFTLSRYERDTGKWELEQAPVYHIID